MVSHGDCWVAVLDRVRERGRGRGEMDGCRWRQWDVGFFFFFFCGPGYVGEA